MASSPSLPVDILRIIVSYSDAATLAALDLTCREMALLSDAIWAALAQSCFDLQRPRGKDAWKAGVALARPPQSNHSVILRHPPEYKDAFSGSTVIAQNEAIVVLASDQHDHVWDESNGVLEFPIQVRDAKSLDVLKHFDCGVRVWEVAICGPPGNEIIVVTTLGDVIAFYGDESVSLHAAVIGHPEESKIIAKADVLLVLRGGFLYVYTPNITSSTPQSLDLTSEIQIANPSEFQCTTFAWSSDTSEFGYCIQENQVCIWGLYGDSGHIKPFQRQVLKSREPGDMYVSLAFHHRYAAVAQDSLGGIVVFDRTSGAQMYRVSDTIRPAPLVGPGIDNGVVAPSTDLVMTGKYMISSSANGCALGVWDILTGEHSYQSMEDDLATEHADGDYPAKLVLLSGMEFHALVGTSPTGELLLWGFPECRQHEELLENIHIREAKIKLSIDEANVMDESL
jgi:hypothetical protein